MAAKVGNEFHLYAANPEATHAIAEQFNDFYNNTLSAIPGLSLILTSGFYGGWIPFLAVIICWLSRKKSCLGLVPIILTTLVLLICPSPLARYIMPSVYTAIPAVGWCLNAVIAHGAATPTSSLFETGSMAHETDAGIER